jgi:hypothetical protein
MKTQLFEIKTKIDYYKRAIVLTDANQELSYNEKTVKINALRQALHYEMLNLVEAVDMWQEQDLRETA